MPAGAFTGPALLVGVRFEVDGITHAILAPDGLCLRTGHTRSGARGIATIAVHAKARNAIRIERAQGAVGLRGGELIANTRTIAFAGIAFIVRIEVVTDHSARAVITAALFRGRARHARQVADIAAAEAIDAIVGQTLRRRRTRNAIVELTRSRAGARAVRALIVGIRVVRDIAARAVCPAAFLQRRTGLASTRARRIATNAVDAIAGRTLGPRRARGPVGQQHLRLIACARSITFAGVAFVVRIEARIDRRTNAIVTGPFFGVRTRVTRTGANVAATKPVDAIIRETLRGRRTSRSVVVTTSAITAASTRYTTFFVGIGLRGDVSTRSVDAATFFQRRARHAIGRARRIAAKTVDTIARRALPRRYTHRAIGLRRLRLITRRGTIAFAGIAFVLQVATGSDGFAYAIVAVTLFRGGTSRAELRTDIAAANAVNAIIGQTLRLVIAGQTIVLFANARAITRARPTFVVEILVVRDESTRSVGPAAFFRRRTCHARAQTPAVATYTVRTISGLALRCGCARRAVGAQRLRARITSARSIALAGIAFIVGIRCRFDRSARAVVTAALFRRAARLTAAHADIAAAKTIDAIVRQTRRGRCARDPIVILALVFPVTCPDGAVVVGIGIVRNGSANAIHAGSFFRRAARHARVIAFRVATKTVDAKPRRALIVRRARRCIGRRRRRLCVFLRHVPSRIVARIDFVRRTVFDHLRRLLRAPAFAAAAEFVAGRFGTAPPGKKHHQTQQDRPSTIECNVDSTHSPLHKSLVSGPCEHTRCPLAYVADRGKIFDGK